MAAEHTSCLAITIHNIPEGLAIGVAFGAVAVGYPGASLAAAVALALGIGIQNFPEGAAVSVPLRREDSPDGSALPTVRPPAWWNRYSVH